MCWMEYQESCHNTVTWFSSLKWKQQRLPCRNVRLSGDSNAWQSHPAAPGLYCGSSDVILFPSLKAENALFLFKNFRIAGKSAQTCEILVNIIYI